jgi:uncharacterized membrane protein YozB (DUF420 family)
LAPRDKSQGLTPLAIDGRPVGAKFLSIPSAFENEMDAGLVILILKIAVVAVTVLLIASLTALYRGQIRLHGRINYVFFALTLAALLGLEVIVRILQPDLMNSFFDARPGAADMLRIHLMFSLPSAVLLFFMLFTGLKHMRSVHIGLGVVFLVLWAGTFVTGVFYLPHQ